MEKFRRGLIIGMARAAALATAGFSFHVRGAEPAAHRQTQCQRDPKGNCVSQVEFSIGRDGHIVLPVRLNGHEAVGILDSGAGPTAIDAAFARERGIDGTGGIVLKGFTDTVSTHKLEGCEIEIGNQRIALRQCISLNLSNIASSSGQKIDVVIGRDFFEEFLIDINFSQNILHVLLPNAISDLPQKFKSILHDNSIGGSKNITISIENGPTLDAIFDLGCASPLLISPTYAEHSRLLDSRKHSTALGVGIEGLVETTLFSVHNLAVGRTNLSEIPTEIPPAWNRKSDAVVGLPVLRKFRNIISYKTSELWLLPDPNEINRPIAKDRSGLGARFIGDALKIVHVAPHSPAEKAGLVIGDEICAVDGNMVSIQYLQSHPRQGERPAGTVQSLTLRNGDLRTLILEDYY